MQEAIDSMEEVQGEIENIMSDITKIQQSK
jgi:hypothetical protein